MAVVEPILRFLQLLCENHNATLQNYVRSQHSRTDQNLVAETLALLYTVCGGTKGSLGVFAEIGVHGLFLFCFFLFCIQNTGEIEKARKQELIFFSLFLNIHI